MSQTAPDRPHIHPSDPPDKTPPMPRSRRPAPHDSDMYAIFRKSPDGAGQQAWLVHLSRGGRMIQSTFSDSTYGGREAALFVARAFRDAVLQVIPPLTHRDMRMLKRKTRRDPPGDHPRSEIAGVHYAAASGPRHGRWIARIEIRDASRPTGRRAITRSFSVAEHGFDAAREAAEAERIRMVMAVENGEDPALRNPAATRLHRRLAKGAAERTTARDQAAQCHGAPQAGLSLSADRDGIQHTHQARRRPWRGPGETSPCPASRPSVKRAANV